MIRKENEKNITRSPHPEVKHLELLMLAQSLISCSREELLGKFPDMKSMVYYPRLYHLNLSNATITCVINAFDVCDICLIEFDCVADMALCRHLCRAQYLQVEDDLWVFENLFIQCDSKVANRFYIGWRHDEVLGNFSE